MRITFLFVTLFSGMEAKKITQSAPIFDFIPLENTKESYQRIIPNSWSGGLINTSTAGNPEFFYFGSRFTQPGTQFNVLSDWVYGTVCSVWIGKNTIGPFKLLGDIPFNNFSRNGQTYPFDGVPWAGCRPSVRCLPASTPKDTRCALIVYMNLSGPKLANGGVGTLRSAYYGVPLHNYGYIAPFPHDKLAQSSFILYAPLSNNEPQKINEEISLKLKSWRPVQRVNGYNYSTYVLNNFTFLDLATKIPNFPVGSVNPQPLIDAENNQEALVEYNGTYKSIMFYRFYKRISSKQVETLAIVVGSGFPWENGQKFTFYNGAEISFKSRNIEDPFCWINRDKQVSCLLHDFGACGDGTARSVCGSIMHFQRNLANRCDSIAQPRELSPNLCWSLPTKVYNAIIPNLLQKVVQRQRPYLFFRGGNPCQLNTGVVWANNPPGGNLPVEIYPGCNF